MATLNLTLGTDDTGGVTSKMNGVILQPGDVIHFAAAGKKVLAVTQTTVEIQVGLTPLPAAEIRAKALDDGSGGFLITFANPAAGAVFLPAQAAFNWQVSVAASPPPRPA